MKHNQMVKVKVNGKIFVGRYGAKLDDQDAGPRVHSVYFPVQDAYTRSWVCSWFSEKEIVGVA